METRTWKPFAALLVVQFSFASLAVAGKVVLGRLDPLIVAGIRLFFASLFLAAIALYTQRERVSFRDALQLLGLAILGVAGNQLLFLEGLSRTTAINATILIATIPVFTTAVAIIAGKEDAKPVRIAGILIALAGALILIGVESFDLRSQHTLGNLLVVANSLLYSFYLVFSRPMLNRYRSTTVVAWTFLFGALIVTPIAVSRLPMQDFSRVPSNTWWWMAWIVIVPSVVAYSLNNFALKRIRSSTVATYVFLQPLIGIGLALLILPDETVSLRTAIGGALILCGVILVSRSERFEPLPAVPESGEAMSREPIEGPNGGPQP